VEGYTIELNQQIRSFIGIPSSKLRQSRSWKRFDTHFVAVSRRSKRRLLVGERPQAYPWTDRNAASDRWQGQEVRRGKVHGSSERPPDEARLTGQGRSADCLLAVISKAQHDRAADPQASYD